VPLEKLPPGYSGTNTTAPPDDDVIAMQGQPDQSVLDMIMSAPSNISRAVSGEGVPIQFPEMPELTDMGYDSVGFFEGFMPSIKAMFSRDDLGKAEIMEDAFKDDSRWGGKFIDDYGFPIVVWNGVPYYINKPGASTQDFNTMLGELIRYIPATKYVSKGKTFLERAFKGAAAYGTTEAATMAGEALITPQTVEAKDLGYGDVAGQIGTSTAIGVAADAALPPIGRALGRGARAAAKGASTAKVNLGAKFDEMFPRFSYDLLQESKYPLTQGQRTAELPQGVTPRQTEQLGVEDRLRNMPSSDPATLMIRGFDDTQLSAIRNDAVALQQQFGAGTTSADGIYGNIPSVAGEAAQETVSGAAQRLKQESGTLYDAVKGVDSQPMMTPQGIEAVSQDLLDTIPAFGMTPDQIVLSPVLMREVTQLRRLRKLAQNPKFKSQSLNRMHGYQKRIKAAVKQAEQGSAVQAILIQMKDKLDKSIYDGIERGFITGDQEVLDQLKEATGLYADYMAATGRGVGKNTQERAANRILEQLSNNQYTPVQVANLLFGQNKFAPDQSMGIVLDKLKKSLDPSEYQQFVALLKDGIMTKAFAGRGGEITRKSIVENYNDVFFKNRAIIDRVFSPQEIARVKEFRANVLPTLWAEIKMNPSGSGYTLLAGAARAGMIMTPSGGLTKAAFGKVMDVAESAQARDDAFDAVSQTIQTMQMPMFSAAGQSAIRTALSPEIEKKAEAEPPSDREKLRLLETIESLEAREEEPTPSAKPAPKPQIAPPPNMPMPQEEVSAFEPLSERASSAPVMSKIDPATSPTILPSDKDRELAMRLRGPLGGIASLA